MGSPMGMIIGTGMRESLVTGMRTGISASMECWYGMLQSWNSVGCAGLGTLYILSVVVVMIDDSN